MSVNVNVAKHSNFRCILFDLFSSPSFYTHLVKFMRREQDGSYFTCTEFRNRHLFSLPTCQRKGVGKSKFSSFPLLISLSLSVYWLIVLRGCSVQSQAPKARRTRPSGHYCKCRPRGRFPSTRLLFCPALFHFVAAALDQSCASAYANQGEPNDLPSSLLGRTAICIFGTRKPLRQGKKIDAKRPIKIEPAYIKARDADEQRCKIN